MLAFNLTVLMVLHGAAIAAAGGAGSNSNALNMLVLTGPNPEETGRLVLQCEATLEGSQVMGITRGSQQVSWNGTLGPDFDRVGTPPRFVMARVKPIPGKIIDLLTINSVCASDEGTYNCNIYDRSMSGGSMSYVVLTSQNVDISVRRYDSSDLCQNSGEVSALRGDDLKLVCSWRSRRASLSWTYGRNRMSVDSVKTVVESVSSAETNRVVTDDLDGETFQCSASVNVCSPEVSINCTVGPITVVPEPQVTVTSVKNIFEPGDRAMFACTLIPSVTSSPPIVSWRTVPPLEAGRLPYLSAEGVPRMQLERMSEEDDGMVVYCTTTFGRHSATGEYKVVVSSNVTGTNSVVNPTGDAVQTTSPPASNQPFILFGSYPLTVALVSGGSVLVALLLALLVFCCCRGRSRRKARPLPPNNRQLRLSPSTFGTGPPGHSVPGGGTDGLYMYSTVVDPDEQWGATPSSTPSMATTVRADDVGVYQQPRAGSSTPPVYSQVGAPTFNATPIYMETHVTSPSSAKYFEICPPGGMAGNALYDSSGEYVNPELTNQETVDKELPLIRAEKRRAATGSHAPTTVPSSSGYLAIGQVPDAVRAGSAKDMNGKSAVYMEIS